MSNNCADDILLLAQSMLESAGGKQDQNRHQKRQKVLASAGDDSIEDIDTTECESGKRVESSSEALAPSLMREEFKFITRQFKFMKKLIGFGKKEEAEPGKPTATSSTAGTSGSLHSTDSSAMSTSMAKTSPPRRVDSLRDDGCNRLRVPGLCLESATVREAALLMESGRHSALLITHANGTLAGILTERDILRRVASIGLPADSTLVRQVMTSDPDYITLETSALDALSMMLKRRYRHLPVVEVAATSTTEDSKARPSLRPVALVGAYFVYFPVFPCGPACSALHTRVKTSKHHIVNTPRRPEPYIHLSRVCC